MPKIELDEFQYNECENLAIGSFYPLDRFMNSDDLDAVSESFCLSTGEFFPLPVLLDLDKDLAALCKTSKVAKLVFNNEVVGELAIESIFSYDRAKLALAIFQTDNSSHPGVKDLYSKKDFFISGKINMFNAATRVNKRGELTPLQTKEEFTRLGWSSVVGFQTRNIPHRAHEYLQRIALEYVDGLFIQPLVGKKKIGDFQSNVVMAAYRKLISSYYPSNRVILGQLTANMRYAGPREALFHALIRRNYGCTHFIVGRDHAGVDDWYGLYDAHNLALKFQKKLGIEIMAFNGPYYCVKCDTIVTSKTCAHWGSEYAIDISGSDVRKMLRAGSIIDSRLMRPDIIESVRDMDLFC